MWIAPASIAATTHAARAPVSCAIAQETGVQTIFDTSLTLARKRRALAQPMAGADFLMRRSAAELADRLAVVERRFPEAAAIFCLTPQAAEAIAGSGKAGRVRRIEADAALLAGAAESAGAGSLAAPETVPLEAASLDLAVSLLTMHEVNDLPGLLVQLRQALRPDGLFLGAMAGGGTLAELRESLLAAETELTGGASPRVAPFADLREVGALLQRAGFALPVTDVDTVTVRYPDLFALMRDLRGMGATNALVHRARRPAGRALFLRAAQIYAERFSDADGRIRATFSLVWMSGWAPHPSQQKPLEPGSARMPLAQALRGS
jgi:SAM-dependent methyltransferase